MAESLIQAAAPASPGGSSYVVAADSPPQLQESFGNSATQQSFGNSPPQLQESFGNSATQQSFGNSAAAQPFGNSTTTQLYGNSGVQQPFGNNGAQGQMRQGVYLYF